MMITKVRRLGLGLFPAEKDIGVGEKPSDFDLQSNGKNGSDPGSNRSLLPTQALECFDAEAKALSDRNSQPESVSVKPNFKRSSRMSYGLELFEAALRESAGIREKERAEIEDHTEGKEQGAKSKSGSLRSSLSSIGNESKPNIIRISQTSPRLPSITSIGSESKPNLIRTSQTTSRLPVTFEADTRMSGSFGNESKPNIIRTSQTVSRLPSITSIGSESKPNLIRTSQTASRLPVAFKAEARKNVPGREKEIPHFVEKDAEELCVKLGERYFEDDDHIKLVQKKEGFRSVQRMECAQCYLIIIPNDIMIQVPDPPYLTPTSKGHFYIRVVMVPLSKPASVDAAIDWLMGDSETNTKSILGLKCELGPGKELNLIQLSFHRRCVLIRLLKPSDSTNSVYFSPRLARLLAMDEVVKAGTETQDDAVAIFWATGMAVNSFINVAEVHVHKQRPRQMMTIFRILYNWEWTRRPEIVKSDWGRSELSSRQIKHGILNAWTSRMVALEGAAAVQGAVTLMSLENIPGPVLDLFGRAIADAFRTEESAANETSGTLSETSSPGTLQLTQHSFRSRVKGRCVVEMHLKEEQGSAQYKVTSRKGKSVLLTPSQSSAKHSGSESSRKVATVLAVESIKSITISEGPKSQLPWRTKRLWESMRSIILDPATCPQHLLLVFGRNMTEIRDGNARSGNSQLDLTCEPFSTISRHLNDSQREAWENILKTPLSATIGPPGTGKTSLIQSVAKSWIARRGPEPSKEILICTAYQNVAVRHLAETLVEGEVPGVLLLISEDYYSGWHEGFYTQLRESLVVSCFDQSEFGINLTGWRARNDGRAFPNVVVCTVDLIGSPSFVSSLMNGKVTALIIDEGSQASDTSFLRPLISLPDLAMVSVLGDPYQLSPYAAVRTDALVVPSVFDLVSNSCRVNFLREQYRMPPSICEFLSAEIYDNVLMTAPIRHEEKDATPLVWSHIKGATALAPGKTSLYNAAEAAAVVNFCKALVQTMKVPWDRVVVLTLYEEQTRRIADGLAAIQVEIPVHNVDSFQGQQCDVVVISLVASRSFSCFAADQRRACVMLSRVRRFLCLFGDFDEVKRNPQAGLWTKLANHCKKQNLVIDEDKVVSFLSASLEEAKDIWVPRKEKIAHVELLSSAATTAAETPSHGFNVQVVFKARS